MFLSYDANFLTCCPEMLITNVLTKHLDFALSNADISIVVRVLPLTYVLYPWSEHCECALMQK